MNRDEIIKKCEDGLDITWEEYCSCANDTLSNNFYTDKVSFSEFHLVLTNFIKAANDLDKIKKALFYGVAHDLKDLNCWPVEGLDISLSDGTIKQWEENYNIHPQLIHSILGIAGESGELVELLLEGLYSDEFDTVNLFEELGDIFWFLHIPYKLAEDPDSNKYQNTLRANLLKLDKRYKKKFSNEQAINRDLDQERKVLEANV
jgi:NTP pyrophosphatase (non-canonical NTP hydrolase)